MNEILPAPYVSVQLQKNLHPSTAHYVWGDGCRLRGLADIEAKQRLPPSVFSIRGILSHVVIELAARGRSRLGHEELQLDCQGDATSTAKRAFHEATFRLEQQLSTTGRAHLVPLRSTMTTRRWLEFSARTIRAAAMSAGKSGHHSNRHKGCRKVTQTLLPGDTRYEYKVASECLRIHGIIDKCSLSRDGVLEISDYKTGRALDAKGIRPTYALQLQLYALALEDMLPEQPKRIVLRIDAADGIQRVSSSRKQLAELEGKVLEAIATLPLGETAKLREFAYPSKDCLHCPIRHRCSSYQEWAVDRWKVSRREKHRTVPLDVWGEILSISETVKYASVKLRCADGVTRKITRLRRDHRALKDAKIGAHLWAFGLATRTASQQGVFVHPRNFYEFATSPNETAWSASLFVSH